MGVFEEFNADFEEFEDQLRETFDGLADVLIQGLRDFWAEGYEAGYGKRTEN